MRVTTKRMLKTVSLIFAFLLALSTVFSAGCGKTDQKYTPLTQADYLTAIGQDLYNAKGEKVLLNGVNLGGWLHFEGWMDGGGEYEDKFVNHYAVREYLESRFELEQVEELLETYQQNYITIDDLKYIRSLGLNFVRVPFFWTEILDKTGAVKPNAFDQLDWVIKECSNLGMYVLLDLHGAPGGQSNGAVTGGHTDSNELWTNETYQQWTVLIWQTVANRYKDNYAVYGYDLLNEPIPPDAPNPPDADADVPSTTHDTYDMLYDAVREVDKNHIIVLEAFWHCKFLGDPKDSGWENVVYQMHMYHDSDKTESAQMGFVTYYVDYIKRYKEEWDVAFLVGEYNFWSAKSAWEVWLNTWNTEGVSWCSWTYKNIDKERSNNWGFYYNANVEQVDYANDSFDEIARKWRGYSTQNYERNEFLYRVITECANLNQKPYNGTELDRSQFTATAYQSGDGTNPYAVLDGDNATRWTNGEAQNSDKEQVIEINFGKTLNLNAVRLFTCSLDYGREYEIYYNDKALGGWKLFGKAQGKVWYTDVTANGVLTNKIKIYQKGVAETNFWSIYEINFYGE